MFLCICKYFFSFFHKLTYILHTPYNVCVCRTDNNNEILHFQRADLQHNHSQGGLGFSITTDTSFYLYTLRIHTPVSLYCIKVVILNSTYYSSTTITIVAYPRSLPIPIPLKMNRWEDYLGFCILIHSILSYKLSTEVIPYNIALTQCDPSIRVTVTGGRLKIHAPNQAYSNSS